MRANILTYCFYNNNYIKAYVSHFSKSEAVRFFDTF